MGLYDLLLRMKLVVVSTLLLLAIDNMWMNMSIAFATNMYFLDCISLLKPKATREGSLIPPTEERSALLKYFFWMFVIDLPIWSVPSSSCFASKNQSKRRRPIRRKSFRFLSRKSHGLEFVDGIIATLAFRERRSS